MTFGGWSISAELYAYLVAHVPAGETIIELGSGAASAALAARWNLWSIEDDVAYVGLYHRQYIHAPLVIGSGGAGGTWYDPAHLRRLPACAVLLVDGPRGSDARGSFTDHHGLFDASVPWVFDDVHRAVDRVVAEDAARMRGDALQIYRCADGKAFGVVGRSPPAPSPSMT